MIIILAIAAEGSSPSPEGAIFMDGKDVVVGGGYLLPALGLRGIDKQNYRNNGSKKSSHFLQEN